MNQNFYLFYFYDLQFFVIFIIPQYYQYFSIKLSILILNIYFLLFQFCINKNQHFTQTLRVNLLYHQFENLFHLYQLVHYFQILNEDYLYFSFIFLVLVILLNNWKNFFFLLQDFLQFLQQIKSYLQYLIVIPSFLFIFPQKLIIFFS